MPLPDQNALNVDSLLTQVAIGYSNPNYISDDLFPWVNVKMRSGYVPKYDQSYWFRDDAKLRAPGTKSQGGGWDTDNTTTYYCHRYSYRHEIPDEVRDNAAEPYNVEASGARLAADKIAMRRDRQFVSDFFTTSVWSNDVTGGTTVDQWSAYASSAPIVDMDTYKDTVLGTIGREPSVFAMGNQVWIKLKNHPDLLDTIKYTERAIVPPELFASLCGLSKVRIGKAIVTTTKEGTAESSVTYSRIWGKHALLLYVPESPSLDSPAGGYCFTWNRVPSSRQYVVRHRDDERETDIIEANTYFDHVLTEAGAGVFFSGIVA